MTGVVESVNVGEVREVQWKDRSWTTGIFKEPVEGRVRAEGVSIGGDAQADLSVHGGPTKSVYAYAAEHYDAWRGELGPAHVRILETPGAFGENLTTRGLLETEVGIGDRYRIGDAVLVVTEPRLPCSKLGMRFDDPMMVKRFHAAGRNGIYFGIEAPGEIGAGDRIELIERHPVRLTVAQVVDLHAGRSTDAELAKVASEHTGLPQSWRTGFREALQAL